MNPLEIFEPVDLHPDLEPYVFEHETFGRVLHHPLMIQLFFPDGMNKIANEGYEAKLAACASALEEGNLFQYVFFYERPYRMGAFMEIVDDIDDDEEYWSILGSIWIDSENIHAYVDQWEECLTDARPGRENFMEESDREVFADLPDLITIWRGTAGGHDPLGWSWTTNEDTAEWFARRFDLGDEIVICRQVHKSDVIAYLGGRGESEIVVNPEDTKEVNP